jgi:hypothetical protein
MGVLEWLARLSHLTPRTSCPGNTSVLARPVPFFHGDLSTYLPSSWNSQKDAEPTNTFSSCYIVKERGKRRVHDTLCIRVCNCSSSRSSRKKKGVVGG